MNTASPAITCKMDTDNCQHLAAFRHNRCEPSDGTLHTVSSQWPFCCFALQCDSVCRIQPVLSDSALACLGSLSGRQFSSGSMEHSPVLLQLSSEGFLQ